MKISLIIIAAIFSTVSAFGKQKDTVEATPASRVDAITKDKTRDPGLFGEHWWINRFISRNAEIQKVKGKSVDVVFIGDSIMHFWPWKHPKSWSKFTKNRSVLNLGYGGDRTQHVLWRIAHGELDGYEAKCIVLMIGTNNNTFKTTKPENVANAIMKIVAKIREKQPKAKLILHPIFPRGRSPRSTMHAAARKRNKKTNEMLKQFAEKDGKIIWIDFNDKLLDKNGWVPRSIMRDEIHPTEAGYDIWMKALEPVIK
jgi:lysophospholipase L1-like esterase